MVLYFMRHAASEANALDILAGRIDYPLSARGLADAETVARAFAPDHPLDTVISSPLLRARQTAEPFIRGAEALAMELDEALVEQDMGIFAGKTYAEAESNPAYERDKARRWDWVPPGGESYRMIAERLRPFFARLESRRSARPSAKAEERILVVTHAVTLRLIVALLEASLPDYPTTLLRNAEILEVEFLGLGPRHRIQSHYFGEDVEAKA